MTVLMFLFWGLGEAEQKENSHKADLASDYIAQSMREVEG